MAALKDGDQIILAIAVHAFLILNLWLSKNG